MSFSCSVVREDIWCRAALWISSHTSLALWEILGPYRHPQQLNPPFRCDMDPHQMQMALCSHSLCFHEHMRHSAFQGWSKGVRSLHFALSVAKAVHAYMSCVSGLHGPFVPGFCSARALWECMELRLHFILVVPWMVLHRDVDIQVFQKHVEGETWVNSVVLVQTSDLCSSLGG